MAAGTGSHHDHTATTGGGPAHALAEVHQVVARTWSPQGLTHDPTRVTLPLQQGSSGDVRCG